VTRSTGYPGYTEENRLLPNPILATLPHSTTGFADGRNEEKKKRKEKALV